jgi:hypothetical protein
VKGSDRYTTDRIKVVCTCCGRDLKIINLGLGGFFVEGEIHPRSGESITLEVTLPGRPAFRVYGVVAWINPPDRSRAPDLPEGFGVRIQQIGLADKLALVNFLRECERQKVR